MRNKQIQGLLIFSSFYFLIQLVSATHMLAQNTNGFATKGMFEFGGNISYTHTSFVLQGTEFPAQSSNTFSFLPYAGYFITDGFEVGINPLGIQSYWDSQDRVTTATFLVAPAYNWKIGGTIYPFLEGQIGYSREAFGGSLATLNPSNRDGFTWGGRGGLKVAVTEGCLLNLGFQYQQISLTPKGQSERSGSNVFMVSAGFTFWL